MEEIRKYIVDENVSIREALRVLNGLSHDVLTLFVLNGKKQVVGTLTDGDIRRNLIAGVTLDSPVSVAMHKDFRYIVENKIDIEGIMRMRASRICLIPCLDEKKRLVRIYNLKEIKSLLPIDAVLMAGGRGERLRPLTDSVPKPLLKIGDKSIIDYNIGHLKEYGIENFFVTVNYLAEQIEQHFVQVQDVKIRCVRETNFLGTLGAARMIKEWCNDTVLVMNSDLFTNIDLEEFYLHFVENQADMSVAAVPYSVSVPYGIFEGEEERITDVKEKPVYNYYANSGIYLIKRELLSLIPENRYFDATDFIRLLINKGYKVTRFPLLGFWIDVGKPEDFKKAQEFVKYL